MKYIFALGAALLLAGCSSTPADLEAKAAPIVQTYSENYQEIYRLLRRAITVADQHRHAQLLRFGPRR
ncbi:lipoprotein [Bradyrhizobium sp. Arg816]|uniref:lipoprotein n=1 Tax=Bradyrhizobium sp. Arg816 TaxID=2998491 RepID=UPI0034D44016